MNQVVSEALRLSYLFAMSYANTQTMSILEKELLLIAGEESFCFSGQMAFLSSYEEVQKVLSRINERESIRKSKGVYYTPIDVVKYIVANTIKSSQGQLRIDNIKSTSLESVSDNALCFETTVFEPTCGAGEFLLEALEIKLNCLQKITEEEIDAKDICAIVSTLFGNDINMDSIIISKLRLFICAIHRFGIEKCIGLADILNKNFTTMDYVTVLSDDTRHFDIILGNPPYVEDSQSNLDLKVKYGNIYANVLENASRQLKSGGSMGFIIPLSYASTPRMKKIRDLLLDTVSEQYVLSYADRPDCLFDSVHQKLCILIGKKTFGPQSLYTGNYQYWYQEERGQLFASTQIVKNDLLRDDCIPKLGNEMDISIFKKIMDPSFPTVYSVSRKGHESVYLNRREAFWIKAFREEILHPEYKVFSYETPGEADYCYCLVNSSLFWWYWISVSDCWHVSKELNGFCAPVVANFEKATQLADELRKKLEETKVYVGTKQTEYEYKHKLCLNEIHRIDDFVNAIFGLSEEESEYIKAFALRYRISGGATEVE